MKNALSPRQVASLVLGKAESVSPLDLDNLHPLTIARATAHYKKTVVDMGAFKRTSLYTLVMSIGVAVAGYFYKLEVTHEPRAALAFVLVVAALWAVFTILRYGIAKNRTTRIPHEDRVMLAAFQEALERARTFDVKLESLNRDLAKEEGRVSVLSPAAAHKLREMRTSILAHFMSERSQFVQYDQRLLQAAASRRLTDLKTVAKA